MTCDCCKNDIALIKPLCTCNIVDGSNYEWTTYVLCRGCFEELKGFLGEKKSNGCANPEFFLGVDLADSE